MRKKRPSRPQIARLHKLDEEQPRVEKKRRASPRTPPSAKQLASFVVGLAKMNTPEVKAKAAATRRLRKLTRLGLKKYLRYKRDHLNRPVIACLGGCGRMVQLLSLTQRCHWCRWEHYRTTPKRRIWKTGYAYVAIGNRPKMEHVQIAEATLGRPMVKGEVVHHIDLNRANNARNNLLICDNKYHLWLHMQYGRQFVERILCPQSQGPNKSYLP